ncbi:DUF6119 family protein [Priestia flexa]|uniref:DUF6119 family protein n=1 Tax=Priestia flexa TaxID=86664 RepID=UPI0011A3A14D|nr:DUF6119 family protein [Priestia flexa]
MQKINLYKIDNKSHKDFKKYLNNKAKFIETKKLNEEQEGQESQETQEEQKSYLFSLFKIEEKPQTELRWNWVLKEFGQPNLSSKAQPKAILVVENDKEMYAVTFGSAFFLVDKFCDRNYAFKIARRMKYVEIKTTTLLSPNMQRNKNVSTYINYEDLEFESGESFAKLKAKLKLDKISSQLIGETIEFGNSIKFDLQQPNLKNIVLLLKFLKTILNQKEIYKIPVFNKVNDHLLLDKLESNLFSKISKDIRIVKISELDIIGVSEIFNNQDTSFELWHGQKRKKIEDLSFDKVEDFAKEKNIDLSVEILNINVKSFNNGQSIRTDKIKNLIDYVDDENRCVLSKGSWYHYNDDYQKYLEDSIRDIQIVYNDEYDFSDKIHQDFIDKKFIEEKKEARFEGMSDLKIKEKLKNKYYAERAFNLLRVEDGFKNYDRVTDSYAGAQIELMDLYKEKTMYAVKIGNASSSLCYAVDQSISSLKMYKHHTLKNMPNIEKVAVWLVLKREQLPNNRNGQPDLSALNMLMLKNRLDSWKKEVRLQGLTPIIYINYKR